MNQREIQKENTRIKIADAAWQLFAEKGFEKVTIQDIAASAEVSVGLVYYHFGSKDGLMERSLLKFNEVLEQNTHFDDSASAAENIQILIHSYIHEIETAGSRIIRALYKSQFSGIHNYAVDDTSFLYRSMMYYASAVYASEASASEAVRFAITSLRGLIYFWCCEDGKFDLEKRGQTFADIITGKYNI